MLMTRLLSVPMSEDTIDASDATISFGRDRDLAAALLAGDEALFADLVDRWSPAMLRLAELHVSSRAAAEDVVQEAWIESLKGLHRFEGRSTLRTWVFKILLNLARRRGVKDHRTVPFSSLTDGPTVEPERFQGPGEAHPGGWRRFPSPWPDPSPEDALLGAEIHRAVTVALRRLPERQRAVMELRDVHGYEPEEVCELLELTPGNQRVLLHRARALVRAEIELYLEGRRP